jgi:hypothetical protein
MALIGSATVSQASRDTVQLSMHGRSRHHVVTSAAEAEAQGATALFRAFIGQLRRCEYREPISSSSVQIGSARQRNQEVGAQPETTQPDAGCEPLTAATSRTTR